MASFRSGWLLLLLTLSLLFPGRERSAFLAAQYRRASTAASAEHDFQWMALAGLLRHGRTQPGGRRGGGPFLGSLPNTYYGATLPSSADGQIRYNANDESFPGTAMNTYEGLPGPPAGSAYGFRDVPCTTSQQLRAAIAPNELRNGDLIRLTPGTRYTGNFNSWATNLTAYCVIESAGLTGAPARGTRATAAHAGNMAIIETSAGNNGRAIDLLQNTGWVWFRYIKFECNAATAFTDVLCLVGGHFVQQGQAQILVVDSPSDFANRIVFDRILCDVDPSLKAVKRFVLFEAHYGAVLDSTIREIFHGPGNVDSMCVFNSQSTGPIKLINNELNGSSQSFLTGGAGFGGGVTPSGDRSANWEVRRNWLTKSIARKGQVYGGVTYTAGFNAEHKDIQYSLWEGNILQYCWSSYKAGWTVSLSNYGIGGQNERVKDFVMAYCQVLDVAQGIQHYQENSVAQSHDRTVIAHVMIDRFNTGATGGTLGRALQVSAQTSQMGALTFTHLSVNNAASNQILIHDRLAGQAALCTVMTFRKNASRRGTFGWWDARVGVEGTTAINNSAPAGFRIFEWNLLIGGASNPYPANNICPAVLADVFQDAPGGNLALTTTPTPSPHLNYGGGTELYNSPGANVALVLSKTAGCVSGTWP